MKKQLPDLPPMDVGYRMDYFRCDQWWDPWFEGDLAEAKRHANSLIHPVVIRRVSDGRVIHKNKAAKEAGL
jgi:hypothetical protein